MAYLQKDDYTLRIPLKYFDQILNQVAENSTLDVDAIREDAEQTAMSEIGSYLSLRYKIEDEFSKDGTVSPDPRNKDVLKCLMDISLFHLFYTISPRDIPETRQRAYDDCKEKLAAYRDGGLIVFPIFPILGGIEEKTTEDGGNERINLSSHSKFISKPFSDTSNLEEV